MSDSLSAELQTIMGAEIKLIADGKGIFDVSVDGQLIYSKYQTGRFPKPGEVTALFKP
ncbi:Rdx family protein [Pseudomonadales bacterium]|nr:Rdx family protein [Pseudomonadales bacterium]MDB9918064.1 Rdx family protein [Pseudomonadales bacterium]MDB9943161.1 Rdx family protein [Pseudomonadales bacterium]